MSLIMIAHGMGILSLQNKITVIWFELPGSTAILPIVLFSRSVLSNSLQPHGL